MRYHGNEADGLIGHLGVVPPRTLSPLRLVSLRQLACFFGFKLTFDHASDQSTIRIFHSQQKKGERNGNDSIDDRRFFCEDMA